MADTSELATKTSPPGQIRETTTTPPSPEAPSVTARIRTTTLRLNQNLQLPISNYLNCPTISNTCQVVSTCFPLERTGNTRAKRPLSRAWALGDLKTLGRSPGGQNRKGEPVKAARGEPRRTAIVPVVRGRHLSEQVDWTLVSSAVVPSGGLTGSPSSLRCAAWQLRRGLFHSGHWGPGVRPASVFTSYLPKAAAADQALRRRRTCPPSCPP